MSQSDGKNKLKRIEFVFQRKTYNFVLNPEEYSMEEPSRVTITQTKGGNFVERWGEGLKTISFSGTTGFKNGTKNPESGFTKWKELRDLLRKVYTNIGAHNSALNELLFYNYTDDEYWVVEPIRFTLKRSKSRSLLFMYDIQLNALNKITNPPKYSGRLGNPYPIPNTTKTVVKSTKASIKTPPETKNRVQSILPVATAAPVVSQVNAYSTRLRTNLGVVASNIGQLIGGTNGKIAPYTAKYVTKNFSLGTGTKIEGVEHLPIIAMDFPNTRCVPEILSLDLYHNLNTLNTDTIEYESYLPLLSDNINELKLGQTISPEHTISLLTGNSDSFDSTILTEVSSKVTNPLLVKLIKGTTIDLMHIYQETHKASTDDKMVSFNKDDVKQVIHNINYITLQLYPKMMDYDVIIEELRKAELNLNVLCSYNELYNANYKEVGVSG